MVKETLDRNGAHEVQCIAVQRNAVQCIVLHCNALQCAATVQINPSVFEWCRSAQLVFELRRSAQFVFESCRSAQLRKEKG